MLTAGRPGRAAAACALAAALAVALPALAGAAPARADIVRQDQSWVLDALDAPAAWNISKGEGVIVAVIDSGVSPEANDLAGSVLPGPDYTGVGTPPSDPNWGMHGTWMASLIAGHGHGGVPGGAQPDGVLGVAPQAKVLSIRVITDRQDPGYAAYQNESPQRGQRELARAIRYAVAHQAGVISMSLGYDMASTPVRTALQDAVRHNVVVVASAGNSGALAQTQRAGQAPYSFPASYPGVLSVGAVNRYGQPASFSSSNISVEVAAPGVNVPAEGRGNGYWLVSGTSPACALTAGTAALIRSRFPRLPPSLVRLAIMTSTQHRPPRGYDAQVGHGTVDAAAALRKAGQLYQQQVAPGRSTGRGAGLAASHAVAGTRHFGGGPSAVPPDPVGSRGIGTLLVLLLLGAGCLVVVAAAAWRLVSIRRPVPARVTGPPAWASPAAGPGPAGPRSPGYQAGGYYPRSGGYQPQDRGHGPQAASYGPPAAGYGPPGGTHHPAGGYLAGQACPPDATYQPGACPRGGADPHGGADQAGNGAHPPGNGAGPPGRGAGPAGDGADADGAGCRDTRGERPAAGHARPGAGGGPRFPWQAPAQAGRHAADGKNDPPR